MIINYRYYCVGIGSPMDQHPFVCYMETPLKPVHNNCIRGYCNNSAYLLFTHKIMVGVKKLP